MDGKMIPLYKPFMPDSLSEMNSILISGKLSYGYWGKLFEEKLSKYVGVKNIATVNSFNSALLVVISTLDLKPGDEVIASPMSCLASNQPLVTSNLKIIWADIDPKTGTLCPNSVRTKITKNTKVIFHNHHCGYPGYINEINQLGIEFGIFIIDDAIEAFGSEYQNNKIGNVNSDATIFSFQTVRLPNVIDGAAFSFKSDILFEKARRVRDYGIDRSKFRDEIGEIDKNCDIIESGFGATLNEINSYIGYVQMDYIDDLVKKHRENAKKWISVLKEEQPNIEFVGKKHDNPNYWVFGILATNKIESILRYRELGFYASGVHLPNNYYSVFGNKMILPGVEDFYSKFVALPCGWWFSK